MRTALDDASFLARSEHRVTVLALLTEGGKTRSEVREATGISQATLGRVLEDFVDRGWAKTEGRTYALTPFGTVLAEEFGSLLDTIESMQRIEDVARWLPEDAPDPRHFADATVVLPTTGNVLAHIERSQQMLDEARNVKVVSSSVFPDAIRAHADRNWDGVRYESSVGVIGGDALDVLLADPELARLAKALFLETGLGEVYRYDGPIDCMFGIADGTVLIAPLDENDVPRAHVDSSNPVVVEWAEAKFQRYVDEGTKLTVDDFSD